MPKRKQQTSDQAPEELHRKTVSLPVVLYKASHPRWSKEGPLRRAMDFSGYVALLIREDLADSAKADKVVAEVVRRVSGSVPDKPNTES